MEIPLITIPYNQYLALRKTQYQNRLEMVEEFRNYIENETINTKDDLLKVVKTLENRYKNILDNTEEVK